MSILVTAGPITADAATAKVVGVNKTFKVTKTTKVSGLSKAEKKIVKVTVNKKKKTVTVKGLKAGKATFKIGKKTYNVKVGATKIAKKSFSTSVNVGQTKTIKAKATAGTGDKYTWKSSDKKVLTVNTKKTGLTTTMKGVKAGKATVTVTSKNTGKKLSVKVTVKAVSTATATPDVATTPSTEPTSTPSVTTTPAVTGTPAADATATPVVDVTTAPAITATPATDATATPVVDVTTAPAITATPVADATATPVVDVTTAPAVTATPSAIEFTAKQTGEKKITVTNPTLIKKEDITIKRGNSTVTIDKVDIDEAGTTAVVTLAGSIVATEYTVTIGEGKVTFTGEASTVADIQITSDEVAMDDKIGTSTKGYANYVVYNQFGENITAKTSLVANTSADSVSLDPTNGIITIDWNGTTPRLNDYVSVVLMYQNTGKSVSKMLTVATQAAPAEVEVKGVYNRDGKTLSATNVTGDDFYYLFRVKDQYGNYMTASAVDFTSVTPNMYVTTAIGMTNVDFVNPLTLQTITVDGVNYLGFKIDKKTAGTSVVAGDITVMLIPGGSGKTVTDTITVAKGNTVTSLTITNPSALPSGGSVDLEYVALDENGDEVTNYRVLKEVKASDDTRFKWVKEDGKVVLRFTDKDENSKATTPGSAVSCVFQLPNYETRLVTINVTDAVHTASIAGVDSKVAKATRVGDTVSIPVEKLTLQDQYGNSIGTSALADTVGAASDGQLAVMVIEEDANNDVFTPGRGSAKYTDKNGDENSSAYILGSDETFTFNAHGTLLGTENVTFKLVEYDNDNGTWKDYETSSYTGAKTNNTQVGSFTTTLTNTKDSKFVSYDVNTIDTIYAGSDTNKDYEKAVEVKGVLSNGEKVDLTAGVDFKVVVGENLVASVDSSTPNKVTAAYIKSADPSDLFPTTETATTKTGKYNVVINYTGETVEKTVTIKKAAPTTATVAFADGYTKKGVNITAANLNANAASAVSYFMTSDGTSAFIIKAKDSYGVDATVDATGEVTLKDATAGPNTDGIEQMIYTISDIDTENGTVTNNGTETPTFTNFAAGDSFKLTYTVGAATFSTIVSVQ